MHGDEAWLRGALLVAIGISVGFVVAGLLAMRKDALRQREAEAETARWEQACSRAYDAGVVAGAKLREVER